MRLFGGFLLLVDHIATFIYSRTLGNMFLLMETCLYLLLLFILLNSVGSVSCFTCMKLTDVGQPKKDRAMCWMGGGQEGKSRMCSKDHGMTEEICRSVFKGYSCAGCFEIVRLEFALSVLIKNVDPCIQTRTHTHIHTYTATNTESSVKAVFTKIAHCQHHLCHQMELQILLYVRLPCYQRFCSSPVAIFISNWGHICILFGNWL